MSMKTIVVASRKGGTGKSTIVENMAVYASRVLKLSVAVIDSDPQKTAYKFFAARSAENDRKTEEGLEPLPFIKYEHHSPDESLKEVIKELRGLYDLILIDTQGGSSRALISCIQSVDTVVVVTGTSGKDLAELGDIIRAIREAEVRIQDALPDNFGEFNVDMRVLLNKVKVNTKAFKYTIERVQELDAHAPVMSAKIKYVEAINDAQLDLKGRAITDQEIKNPGKASFQLALDELLSK